MLPFLECPQVKWGLYIPSPKCLVHMPLITGILASSWSPGTSCFLTCGPRGVAWLSSPSPPLSGPHSHFTDHAAHVLEERLRAWILQEGGGGDGPGARPMDVAVQLPSVCALLILTGGWAGLRSPGHFQCGLSVRRSCSGYTVCVFYYFPPLALLWCNQRIISFKFEV